MLVHLDATSQSPVLPVPQILVGVQQQRTDRNDVWSQRLNQDPASFGQVELEVHQTLQQAADQIVAGLLAHLGQQSALENAGKKSR